MKKFRTSFIHVIFKIVLIFSLLYSFPGCAKPPEEKEIKKTKDTIEIVFEGIITPSKEEKLLSPISGKIIKVYTGKGKQVTKNQKIAEFDKYELDLEYKKARADYEKAKLAAGYHDITYTSNRVVLNNAKERLLKTYELYKTDHASLAELKNAEDAYMNALTSEINSAKMSAKEQQMKGGSLHDLQKAQLEMEQARHNLFFSDIIAPTNGFLVDFNLSEGQSLSKGDDVGKIIEIDDVILKGAISPGTYKYLKAGRTVDINCITVPPLDLQGVISEISPVVDSETGRMSIYIPLRNVDYLLQPGVKCLISFVMPKKQAEEMGIDTKQNEKKAHIKSDLKSSEVK
jgi:multidrug efflux pump subunit AcrA (membrane-fusion protein)